MKSAREAIFRTSCHPRCLVGRHHGVEAISAQIGLGEIVVAMNPDVVEALFRAEGRRLVGALTVFVADASEAEDIAQEAFARMFAAQSRIGDPDRARNYLYSVAFNLARTRWRRRARFDRVKTRLGLVDPQQAVEAEMLRAEATAEVLAAVSALPTQQRACVVLHCFSDLSVIESAAVLGISSNSAKTHLRRAFANLRVQLAPEEMS